MIKVFKEHPLLTVIIIALLLRLTAVVFSKGFMAHDDYFETVRIAYNGIQNGLLNDDNHLRWDKAAVDNIARSPLYVLSLYGVMKAQEAVGIENLDSMMYLIRLLHALLSLLIVWYGYKYVFKATASRPYAVAAGLILSGHFLMPYLSVRNLIELVSADFLVPSIYLAWRGAERGDSRRLIIAGILGGLAWIIRFNTGLAVLPVPFAIWYHAKRLRPALYFCAGLFIMILFSASLDIPFLGRFGQSTINVWNNFVHHVEQPLLPQPFYMYIPLVLGILIPPFSLYFFVTAFRKSIIRDHVILVSSALCFFIIHSIIESKQERFLIPIFPLLVIWGILGLHSWLNAAKVSKIHLKIFRFSAALAVIVNLLILPVFTFNYNHKGMVEPFVYLSRQDDVKTVLIDRTERRRFVAVEYAGINQPNTVAVDSWDYLDSLKSMTGLFESINYFVVYTDINPAAHADSLAERFGPIRQVFHSPPSVVDRILHSMNPKHNHTNEAWVFKKL